MQPGAGGLPGLGDEGAEGARDAIVEAGSDVDDEVGLLHHEIGSGVPVHAQHVQGEGMPLVEDPHPVQGGRDGNLEGLGEHLELLGGVVAALAGDDDGLLGTLDQVQHLGEDLAGRQGPDAVGGGPVGLYPGLVDGVGGVGVELEHVRSALPGLEDGGEGTRLVVGHREGQAVLGIAQVQGVVALPVGADVRGEGHKVVLPPRRPDVP